MWKNFVFISIFVFVDICLSKAPRRMKERETIKLFQKPEPFSMEDFKKPLPFDDPKICYAPHFYCLTQEHELETVCAFVKNYGLLSFKNVCQVHLHNCLHQPNGTKIIYGDPTANDIIYYNGVDEDCFYYLNNTKSLAEAIHLYYIYGEETETTTEYREVENSLSTNLDAQHD